MSRRWFSQMLARTCAGLGPPSRAKHLITGLHLAALAVQRAWHVRLAPYRISTAD